MTRSDLYDYGDACTVRGTINLRTGANNMPQKDTVLKKMHHLGHA